MSFNNNKKIIMVISGHLPSFWAHSTATLKKADALFKKGYQVEVLAVERFFDTINKWKIKNVHEFYNINKAIKILYFKDNPIFYFRELKRTGHLLRLLENTKARYILDPEKRISNYCVKNRPHICFCRTYRTVYYNIKNKLPTIMDSQTINVEKPDLKKVIELSHSEYFKGLVTVSDFLKQNFIKAGVPKNKILILENGVNLEDFKNIEKRKARFSLNLPRDRFIVLYSGSLGRGRGIEYILEAARILKNIKFVIVGGGSSDVSYWKKVAKEIKLNNVVFVGFVKNSLVPIYLKAADVLLMPYTRDTLTYKWMSPLKLFEYLAAARPIIATDLQSIKKRLRNMETAILVKEKNGREIANAVSLLFKNRKLGKELSYNAGKEAKKHGWENWTKVFLDKYD